MSTATRIRHSVLPRMLAHLETLGELHAHQVRHLDAMLPTTPKARAQAPRAPFGGEFRSHADYHRAVSEIMFREQSR